MDMGDRDKIDELIDLALEESFPASDPPAFMAASAVVGAPKKLPHLKKRESDEVHEVPPLKPSKKDGN
jgi:hypothetical protein